MGAETQTKLDTSIGQWPPVAHIIRKEDEPAKEGTIALCGERLMGIDLQGDVRKATCQKCREVMLKEMQRHQ